MNKMEGQSLDYKFRNTVTKEKKKKLIHSQERTSVLNNPQLFLAFISLIKLSFLPLLCLTPKVFITYLLSFFFYKTAPPPLSLILHPSLILFLNKCSYRIHVKYACVNFGASYLFQSLQLSIIFLVTLFFFTPND